MTSALHVRQNGGGQVTECGVNGWRMEIPPGPVGVYRWAQVDDYCHLPRSRFLWQAPGGFELRARVSSNDLPGTWGFGLWNDPFNFNLGIGGSARRLPSLPNAAWFFYAGAPNYLAFRDTHPGSGFLAATFSSPLIPAVGLAPATLSLPFLAIAPFARLLRRAASTLIGEDAVLIKYDPTDWHTYRLDWTSHHARFIIDQDEILSTPVSPRGKLGLVIWIDNQFAAFLPSGKLLSGTSINSDAGWLEIKDLQDAL